MPMDKKRYPPNWKEIAFNVKEDAITLPTRKRGIIMYEEEVKELDTWFKDKDCGNGTGFDGVHYVVRESDVEGFCDFLRDLNPDLIGFPCVVGTSGIWFERADFDKARYL